MTSLKSEGGSASLVVQWLRLHAPSEGGRGLIPGPGTRSHMLQLRVHLLQLKISRDTARTQLSQRNKHFLKKPTTKKGEGVP